MKIKSYIVFLLPLFAVLPAWAGQGWYLMTPPTGEYDSSMKTTTLLFKAPIKKWNQEQAYDTAAECEAGKKYHFNLSMENKDKEPSIIYRIRPTMFSNSLCIASDDPRLK